jgi:hypothetical protein
MKLQLPSLNRNLLRSLPIAALLLTLVLAGVALKKKEDALLEAQAKAESANAQIVELAGMVPKIGATFWKEGCEASLKEAGEEVSKESVNAGLVLLTMTLECTTRSKELEKQLEAKMQEMLEAKE